MNIPRTSCGWASTKAYDVSDSGIAVGFGVQENNEMVALWWNTNSVQGGEITGNVLPSLPNAYELNMPIAVAINPAGTQIVGIQAVVNNGFAYNVLCLWEGPGFGIVRNITDQFPVCWGMNNLEPVDINDSGEILATGVGGPYLLTPVDGTPPFFKAAYSSRLHRGVLHSLPIDLNPDPDGETIEPRNGGPTTIRIQFTEPIQAIGFPGPNQIVNLSGALLSSVRIEGEWMEVNLSGITDGSLIQFQVAEIADAAGNRVAEECRFIMVRARVGDVNQDGMVTKPAGGLTCDDPALACLAYTDLCQTKALLGFPVTDATCKYDVSLSNTVDLADLSLISAKGTAVASCP